MIVKAFEYPNVFLDGFADINIHQILALGELLFFTGLLITRTAYT